MNSGVQFKISLILACLLFTSALSILLVIAPSSTVVASGADNENCYVIIRGTASQYNDDDPDNPENPAPPWKKYDNRPPAAVAQEVGAGRVFAAGCVPTCRDTRWMLANNWDNLLDYAFQWMASSTADVLWYGEAEESTTIPEYSIYQDADRCVNLINNLEEKGYSIDNTIDDNITPITPGLLTPYDILVIPQFELGAPNTGGDPDLLPDDYVLAIKNFVEDGGGLLIMEGSDYFAYQYYLVQNKILKELGIGMWFQNDTIQPDEFGEITLEVTDNLFGSDYQTGMGTSIGLYGVCSMAVPEDYVLVSISPRGKSGEPGENLTYTVTVKNEGENSHTYNLGATCAWGTSIDPSSVSVPAGEENAATLTITIPGDAEPCNYAWATVTATDTVNENITDNDRAGAEVPEAPQLNKWENASKIFPGVPTYGITVAGAGENIYITNTSQFVRYNTTAGVWEALALPGMFLNGSALCWNNDDYICALPGASYGDVTNPAEHQYKFRRYNISNNSWTNVADTPWHQGPGNALAFAEVGGEKYIYAFIGTSSSSGSPHNVVQFWRYNIADDNWDENLTPNPYGADDGASLAWTGGDYIYAFPGAYDEGLPKEEERHFLRYSISGDNWEEMAKTPYNAEGGVDDGGSLAYPGFGDYIYALKGGSDPPGGSVPADNFWRYSIPDDNWEILQPIPDGVGDNNGRRLGVANGNIYCWRGSFGDGALWVYSLSTSDVDVSISPDYISGMPGATLEFTATVTNTGLENENYELENEDTLSWILELSEDLLTNIAPGENENVTLWVTIPENAEYCAEDIITVTATSLVDPGVSDSGSCIAHQDYFEKVCMPDLGQHCENWCWVAAAANSFWWWAQNGYPELLDAPEIPGPDNAYVENWLMCPGCGQYRRLLQEIAWDCGRDWCMPVNDNDYFHGLQKFISDQGAALEVHEIVDPGLITNPNTPPLPDPGLMVEYRAPTFEDYQRELLRCQDVLLWLNLWPYEEYDHVVTGVGFFENQFIIISDPWTTGMPDHNNIKENKQYGWCPIVSEEPFQIIYREMTITIPKMIFISPEVVENWTGWATFELENMYKVGLEKDLQLNTGSKLVVKFYKYGDIFQAESVIDTFAPPQQIKENENVPHPRGSEGFSWGTVQIAKLVLTTDNTANEISEIASFTVHQSDLRDRYIDILIAWAGCPSCQPAFRDEIIDILLQWASAPP
jgi:hypothetical protein